MRSLAITLLATLSLSLPAQFEVGLNINAPINGSGQIASHIDPSAIARLGVDTVRVNCILGPWSSPNDTALFSGRTWFETYDAIVDGFLAEGIDSYLLIGSEAVTGSSRAAFATDAWTQSYAANFLAVVDHFRDRVSVYETFNEPNDWAGGTSSQVEPRWFAYQLQEIFLAVKYGPGGAHLSDPGYQDLTIVSGPLFAHDIGGSPSPQDGYWTQTRQAGINGDAAIPDLDWSSVHTLTGSYPCDGLGYHIYVLGESDDPSAISARYTQMLNAIWSSFTALEGAGTSKRIWLSEFGWNRDSLTTGLGATAAPSAQGRNLETAMNLLRSDARVAQGHWFSLVDFGGIGDTWGVHSGATLVDSNRNPAWWHLRWQGLVGDGSGNMAENAGFESGDLTGWFEWGQTDGVVSGPWFGGISAHTGSHFHGAAVNFGQKSGGLTQQFSASLGQTVIAGARVRTHREGGSAGDTACRIGIDPAGGTDSAAGTIVWSEALESEDFWRPLVVEATATAGTVTVFLEHVQAAPTWNVTCFDDVAVLGVSPLVPAELTGLLVN
jgi:hypothetical protein